MRAVLADATGSRLLAVLPASGWSSGRSYALIALGYTMVYGIIELINFAHGDLFMLGSFLALTVWPVASASADRRPGSGRAAVAVVLLMLVVVPLFCAGLNWSVDRVVYKPLRNAPRAGPARLGHRRVASSS